MHSIELDRLLEICKDVADALAAAHARNIIHRDIKPGNIFICEGGHSKVLDFGLTKINVPDVKESESATLTLTLTDPGIAMATLPYMSPEQLHGRTVDHRTDIFSLPAWRARYLRSADKSTSKVSFASLLRALTRTF